MTRKYTIAGAGLLVVCLAGWAAFAGAQSMPAKLPPPEPTPPAPVGELPAPPTPSPIVPTRLPAAPPEAGPVRPPVPVPPPPSKDEPPAPPALPTPVVAPPSVAPMIPPPESPPQPTAGRPFVAPEEKAAEPADNPAGRQEPAVSLEWIGSPVAKVGQSADYSLVVRNICNVPVQSVTVRVRVPAGLSLQGSEPKAGQDGDTRVWELGTMMPRQERILQLKLHADARGDVTPRASVTFTGSAVMHVRVREPKLQLKCSAPEKVLVGDQAAFTLTVSNPGDGSADQVRIQAALSDGLVHANGGKIDFDIGHLAPGETRRVTLLCATRGGGAQKCEAVALSEGGLNAKDTATLNVIVPRLDLQLSGPALRYLERKAIYTLKVTNPGDAPATNVVVADMVPAGFKVLAASDGGRHDYQTRTVSWFLGEVGPGQTREVKVEVQAVSPGEHRHKATAAGARGLRAEAELPTRVEGLAALLVEMVDTEDPIEVNGDTAYEVRVTNTGSKTETDIRLVATIPDKLQFKTASGLGYRVEGNTVVFAPIERLAPRADAIIRLNCKALQPGTVRFKIQLSSATLTEPVIKEEATRIYSDAPEGSPAPAVPAGPAPAVPPPSAPAVPTPSPTAPVPPPSVPTVPTPSGPVPPPSLPPLPGGE